METATPLAALVYKYLAWCRKNRSPRTVEWYENHLRGFLDHLADPRSMPATELKPYHLVEWVDGRENWGATSRRGGIVAVQRVLNWAEEMGYIITNPVKKVKKPPARPAPRNRGLESGQGGARDRKGAGGTGKRQTEDGLEGRLRGRQRNQTQRNPPEPGTRRTATPG